MKTALAAIVVTVAALSSSCAQSDADGVVPTEQNRDCEAAFNYEGRTYVNVANQGIEQVELGKTIGFGFNEPCFDGDGEKYMNEHRLFRFPGVPVKEAILFKDGGRGDILVNVERTGKGSELPDYLGEVHTYQ